MSRMSAQEIAREIEALESIPSVSAEDMIETLNIRGWAQWVNTNTGRSLGYAASVWHKQVTGGFRTSRVSYPITDAQAIKLDMMIAALRKVDTRWTNVLVGLFVQGYSYRELASVGNCDKSQIPIVRDMALCYLYAQLNCTFDTV